MYLLKRRALFLTITICLSLYPSEYPEDVKHICPEIEPWIYVNFDESMQTTQYLKNIPVTEQIVGINGHELLSFFRNLYNQNNLSQISPSNELKIPKIIHQIWLGSEVPEVFKRYMNSWVQQHLGRGWFYKLWTDSDVSKIKLRNRTFFDATYNYGIKSDILRYEILDQIGGVYIDTDFECFRSLDILHYAYDFYIGIQPLDTLFVQLGIGIIGARPSHSIIKYCIDTIKDDWHKKGAPKKTGPVHFTQSFYAMAGKSGTIDIAFPTSYFYPLGCRENNVTVDEWIKQGAFGVHWWSKSWMPKNYRPQKFRTIHNDASVDSWND